MRTLSWGVRVGMAVLVISEVVIVVVRCLPVFSAGSDVATTDDVSKAVEFLTRYGYLPPSDPKSGNLRSESEFRSAIAQMQRFGDLTPTGRIDAATVRLMRSRRCGVPDLLLATRMPDDRVRRRYAIQGQKWPSTNLTWSVRMEEGEGSNPGMIRSQLRRAFGVWSAASALTFTEVMVTRNNGGGGGVGKADIVVSFLRGPHGDGYPFDGEGSVLAHAFFPGEGIGGDAHFDAEERWMPENKNPDDGVNLFAVAAHEIGHSLGLSHSSTPGSLMFPYYQLIGDEHFTLPSDDLQGIRHLYGTKDVRNEPTLPPPPTTPTKRTTTTRVTTKVTTTTTSKTRTTPKPRKTAHQPPDICESSIDAISVIRREIFVFKGNHFWRLHTNRTLRAGYPVSIDRFWNNLDIQKIDALYERPSDTKIVFFSGRRHWIFSANQLEPGYPKPLTALGLPAGLSKVDAALIWGHNGKTYLFAGSQYWKLDEDEGHVELDYPRDVEGSWRGVPTPIDAAFQWTDGNTYFFKNNKYWKFVDAKMRVEKKSPSEIGGFWFRCPSEALDTTLQPPVTSSNNDWVSSSAELCPSSCVLYTTCLLLLLLLLAP